MIKAKRWNDPAEPDDGYRLLVCRYRPRGVPKEKETWDAWLPQLGPSRALHAAVYGKGGAPIPWEEYEARYVAEMEAQAFWIRGFAERLAKGERLTLLCSSACTDPARCHRTLLRALIERPAEPARGAGPAVVRRREAKVATGPRLEEASSREDAKSRSRD
jgi:uncharacterized protein YeaO (DUF488 family)